MKRILLTICIDLIIAGGLKAQVTTLAGDYKIVNIGDNGYGDYARSVILLHEMYNGTIINHNYAIGTISAMRGSVFSFNRLNTVQVNTSSAYAGSTGMITAYDEDPYNSKAVWKLKTCVYNGKKYLAVDVPYGDAYHDRGYMWAGATSSTGENMKCVSYEVSGQPVNQSLISNIQDYIPAMIETHEVANLNITGKVGIGTKNATADMLAVNGNIRAKEVKVEINNWPDYVFDPTYPLPTLQEVKNYIDKYRHLPEVPSYTDVKTNGISLGEINKILLKKIEEVTLHLIDKDRQLEAQNKKITDLQSQISTISKAINVDATKH